MDFATYILNNIDQATNHYIFNSFTTLSAATIPLFTRMLALFFILYGMAVWMGYLKPVISELLGNAIKIAIIFILFTQWGWFSAIVVNTLTNTPNQIGGLLLGTTGAAGMSNINDVNQFVGEFIKLGFTKAGEALSWSSLALGVIQALAIGLGTILIGGYMLYLIILSKISLAILLGLGPIFIILLLYKGTNKIFESWVQQCVNYAIIPIFAYGVGIIVFSTANLMLNKTNLLNNLGLTLGFLIVAIIGFLVLMQVTAKAAAIAGGIQLSPMHREIHTVSGAANRFRKNTQGWGRKTVPIINRSSTITRRQ